MEEIICYCKKQEDTMGYSNTRRRWLSAQFRSTWLAIIQLPIAFLQGKWDLCEKLFQWLLPSRFLLIAYIVLCTVIMTLLDWPLSLKWYILLGMLIITLLMALPDGEINKKFRKAFWALPAMILTTIFSFSSRKKKGKKKEAKK